MTESLVQDGVRDLWQGRKESGWAWGNQVWLSSPLWGCDDDGGGDNGDSDDDSGTDGAVETPVVMEVRVMSEMLVMEI